MDCQTFRRKHDAYVDDTLPGVEMAPMRDHLTKCARCARRDADVRRALLLVRNLPPLKVSEGFDERLRARLDRDWPATSSADRRGGHARALARRAVAALLVATAALAVRVAGDDSMPTPVLAPAVVVASPTAAYAPDDPAPAFMASMTTGIPMWPALMHAEEGPLRFATAEPRAASYSREP